VPQSSSDHFPAQLGVLTNGRTRRDAMFVGPVGLDLLSNIFVGTSEPFIRHKLDAHGQILQLTSVQRPGSASATAKR
jgi:hypothetical protein